MTDRFTSETKVAAALDAEPGLVDRLIALNPVFSKLKNPILRRTMARLVTLGEAAKVSGVPLDAILAVANGHAATPRAPTDASAASLPTPDWIRKVDLNGATRLDVRPMLAKGEEPLSLVMRTAKDVPVGGDLVLDAPFDPAPLRRVLGAKGFAAHAERIAADHWRVYFRRESGGTDRSAGADPVAARIWREDGVPHIDVRDLDPPEPMLAVLRLLETPDCGGAVIVHHEREPIYLYPELAERGWTHALIPGDPGEVRLRLVRNAP